jgi:hypothetical protein
VIDDDHDVVVKKEKTEQQETFLAIEACWLCWTKILQ